MDKSYQCAQVGKVTFEYVQGLKCYQKSVIALTSVDSLWGKRIVIFDYINAVGNMSLVHCL